MKYRGVEVGRVVSIEVSPTDLDCVHVQVKIRPGLTMKVDMQATLVYVGLTGQKYIELSGGRMDSPNLKAHGEIPSGRGLGEKADDIINNIETTAKRITEVLSPENMAKIDAFLTNVEKGSAAVSGVLDSRRTSLENTLISVERATADFAQATKSLVPMTEDLDRLIKTVEANSEKTLGNISERFSADEMGHGHQGRAGLPGDGLAQPEEGRKHPPRAADGAPADFLQPQRHRRQPGPLLPGDRRRAVGHPPDTKGQEMMRKLVLPLAAVLLLAACLSSPGKHYFQIVPMDKDAEYHPKIGRPLYVEPVRVDPLYDDYRVIYRVSPYELRYYSTVFWAKKPDALFREAISDYLLRKEGFPRVQMDILQGEPVIALRANVRLIEEIDNPKVWFGRLAMDLEFLDFKSGKTIVRHSFDKRVQLGARKVQYLPAVLSGILVDELDVAVRKLAEALAAK